LNETRKKQNIKCEEKFGRGSIILKEGRNAIEKQTKI
jgi:hypothetical protein